MKYLLLIVVLGMLGGCTNESNNCEYSNARWDNISFVFVNRNDELKCDNMKLSKTFEYGLLGEEEDDKYIYGRVVFRVKKGE